LTVVGINALKKSGRYATATVSIAGPRVREQSSELRTVVRGKRHDIRLGGLKLVSLAEAWAALDARGTRRVVWLPQIEAPRKKAPACRGLQLNDDKA
jgi:hypothetical protein